MIGYIYTGLGKEALLPPYCLGYVNWMALLIILPVSMLLSPLGVKVSHALPRDTLRRVFAVVLTLVAIRMFVH